MASPQLQRLKQMLGVRSREVFDLEAYRQDFEKFARYFPPPAEVEIRDEAVAGIAARRFLPPGWDGESWVLYLHGGGYISGSLGTHQEVMGRLALASGLAVLGVDYRRAPEHPFPAALEDALVAYRGLLGEGVETRRLALAGDSAGGGLALALLATLRDFGYGLPRTAALLSPWVDLTLTAPSLEERRHLVLARHLEGRIHVGLDRALAQEVRAERVDGPDARHLQLGQRLLKVRHLHPCARVTRRATRSIVRSPAVSTVSVTGREERRARTSIA